MKSAFQSIDLEIKKYTSIPPSINDEKRKKSLKWRL